MVNKITAVLIGKPLLKNIKLEKWIKNIKDKRWGKNSYFEESFDIFYFDSDENIQNKLNESHGFDVIICFGNEENFPKIISLNNKQVYEKIIFLKNDTEYDSEYIGSLILNKFYYNMEHFSDNKECFTIFTPCFNTPYKDFMRLYKSLCNQTYGSWEWFILDDSTQENGIEPYIKEINDFRVRCIKNITNHGNVGYNKRLLAMGALNEYLLEIDHDDEITSNCLEKIHEAFVKFPECGFCYSNGIEIGYDKKPIVYGNGWGMGQGSVQSIMFNGKTTKVNWSPDINEISIRHIISAPNHIRCWRSDVYRKIFGHNYNYSIADDYELIVRTFLETKMCYIHDYLYIQHEETETTQRNRNKEIQRCVECIRQLYDSRIHERILELGFEDTVWNGINGYENANPYCKKSSQIMNEELPL